MTKNRPYAQHDSVYDIAAGLRGDERKLLSPDRAIFAALCGVLNLNDEARKKEILGREAYDAAQQYGNMVVSGELSDFIELAPEALPVQKEKVWGKGFQYTDKTKKRSLEEAMKDPHKRNRVVAARLRREYFPATGSFLARHCADDYNN